MTEELDTPKWKFLQDYVKNAWPAYLEKPLILEMEDDQALYTYIMSKIDSDDDLFIRAHGLTPPQFDRLLTVIERNLMASQLSAPSRLGLALRYLRMGAHELNAIAERVPILQVNEMLLDVFNTIFTLLLEDQFPKELRATVIDNMDRCNDLWNFPNCVAAVSGRSFQCKSHEDEARSTYTQIVVVCDPWFRFIIPPICFYTSHLKLECLLEHPLFKAVQKSNDTQGFRRNQNKNLPLVSVGAPIFPRSPSVLLPITTKDLSVDQLFYNWRHNRAMTSVDTALGILLYNWKVFGQPLTGNTKFIESIFNCTVALHNWLISLEEFTRGRRIYAPEKLSHNVNGAVIDVDFRDYSTNEVVTMLPELATEECETTLTFSRYFSHEGFIPLQLQALSDGIRSKIKEMIRVRRPTA